MPKLNLAPRGFIAGVADRIARTAEAASRRLQSKGARSFPVAPWYGYDTVSAATWMPRDTTAFAREGFMQNAIVYRCVRMIAEAAGSIPFCLYDGREEIEDHPLLTLLKAPTPTSTRAEFMETLIGFLLVSGNTYVEAIAAGSDIRELHILRPDRVTLVPGEDGWPEAYDYTVAGASPVRLDGDVVPGIRRVLHQKLFHPLDDHYGLSPIEAAAVAIDIHNSAARWNKALLDNSARPSGALVYTSRDGNLTSEQYQRLKAELEAGFQGAGNAGRPLLLEGGLDWKTMSMSPKDLDFMEAKHGAAREIALALGVPPMLLGIPGDNTFSNYQEANRTFWRSTVLPLVQRLVSGFGTWLTPAYGASLRLDIDLDELPALSTERDELWRRIGTATFLTTAEKRAAAGYGSGEANEPFEPKFNPGQLRKPSGTPGGGQWTKPGSGGRDQNVSAGEGDAGEDGDGSDAEPDPGVSGDDAEVIPVAGGRRQPSGRRPAQGAESEETTTGQTARLNMARDAANESVRRVRELDPRWRNPDTISGGIEDDIVNLEARAEAATARYNDLTRDKVPWANPSWGVNRLRKELYDNGFFFERPMSSPGWLYKNPDTGEQVRIMDGQFSPWRYSPPQKSFFQYYYRYQPNEKAEGAPVPIPDAK